MIFDKCQRSVLMASLMSALNKMLPYQYIFFRTLRTFGYKIEHANITKKSLSFKKNRKNWEALSSGQKHKSMKHFL